MPLERALGLGGLTFYGLGIILGAGIYSVLGAAAGHAGSSLWMCFALSGLVALPTALSYAELATTYPRASAEFTYLRRAWPRWPGVGLVTGLLVALSGAATCGTVAIAFAGYLRSFVEIPAMIVAWALIAAATGLNIIGVKESGWVNVVFTLLEAGGLVLFIVLGATTDGFGEALMTAPSFGVLSGAALVFFSFLGFENIANLAEEAKQPERDLPRAILLSLGIATTLYVLVALAAVALLPAEQLVDSQARWPTRPGKARGRGHRRRSGSTREHRGRCQSLVVRVVARVRVCECCVDRAALSRAGRESSVSDSGGDRQAPAVAASRSCGDARDCNSAGPNSAAPGCARVGRAGRICGVATPSSLLTCGKDSLSECDEPE